jgi:hypothetical protein
LKLLQTYFDPFQEIRRWDAQVHDLLF